MTTTARTTIAVIGVVLMWAAAGQAQSCPGDFNGDHRVTVDDILMSVNKALNDCPSSWLLGHYSGLGWEDFTACTDPADNSRDFYQPAVFEISAQDGESFSGTLSATNGKGNIGTAAISGTVTGTRAISGQGTSPTGSAMFTGVLGGDTWTVLTVTFSGEYREGSRSCQTAGGFLVVRTWPSQ
jgi:hypothetical protein